MGVIVTQAIRDELGDAEAELLASAFALWRKDWPKNEYASQYFGKDSAYQFPSVDGQQYRLRHVHLPPVVDKKQKAWWKRAFERLSRKTSDRFLVYVEGSKDAFLLIYVLPEPDAHAISRMKTPAHAAMMNGFASIAAEFIATGRVIS